jgi:vitamin B12/bleomycin/antimicrobial peptide transport system ATP-binding/permease protein
VARWDRELTDDEQQCLVFTRIFLHKPRWVVIDEALDALEDDARQCVISPLQGRAQGCCHYQHRPAEANKHFFTRVLYLIKDPQGRCFIPDLSVAFGGWPVDRPVQSRRMSGTLGSSRRR